MPLEPKQIQDAFSRAMPGMRREFAKTFATFRATIFRDSDYMRQYPEKVLELTGDEVTRRHKHAATLVRRLFHSGWKPTVHGEVRTVYLGCFGTTDFREDPSSDLYEKARNAHSDIGQPDPPTHQTVVYLLGEIQSQVANEMMTDLETHVVKEPQPTNITHNTFTNDAPVGAQVVGNENVVNIEQHITFDARSVSNAIAVVKQHLDDFPAAERGDVQTYVAEVEDELTQPAPRPSRVKASLAAIGRVAGSASLEVVKAATDGAVGAIMKSLGAPG